MLQRRNVARNTLMIAALLASWNTQVTLFAQKGSVLRPQDKVAFGEDDVKRLLPLMEADVNGKVSKQEFMRFMEAEFTRLDKNKDGQLDVKEMTKSKHRKAPPSSAEIK